MATTPLTVVIDRARWLTGDWLKGGPARESVLYDSKSKRMCCLGFACRAAHLPVLSIADLSTPSEVWSQPSSLQGLIRVGLNDSINDSRVADDLMRVNDSGRYTSKKREARIKALGKKANLNFVFKGRYKKD